MSGYIVKTLSGNSPEIGPYLGIIISNWMTTLKYTNDWFKLIDEDAYYATYSKVIRAILAKPKCQVNLAVLEDNEDVCVGWAVFEPKTLHYWFVRRAGRKQGIGKSLLPENLEIITHLTLPGVVIWKTKFPKAVFNPFL